MHIILCNRPDGIRTVCVGARHIASHIGLRPFVTFRALARQCCRHLHASTQCGNLRPCSLKNLRAFGMTISRHFVHGLSTAKPRRIGVSSALISLASASRLIACWLLSQQSLQTDFLRQLFAAIQSSYPGHASNHMLSMAPLRAFECTSGSRCPDGGVLAYESAEQNRRRILGRLLTAASPSKFAFGQRARSSALILHMCTRLGILPRSCERCFCWTWGLSACLGPTGQHGFSGSSLTSIRELPRCSQGGVTTAAYVPAVAAGSSGWGVWSWPALIAATDCRSGGPLCSGDSCSGWTLNAWILRRDSAHAASVCRLILANQVKPHEFGKGLPSSTHDVPS